MILTEKLQELLAERKSYRKSLNYLSWDFTVLLKRSTGMGVGSRSQININTTEKKKIMPHRST